MSEKEQLRRLAEELLARKREKEPPLSGDDAQSLIHELQVHQIELELQNEELRQAQHEVEESRSRYSDLYDFAPVGYFTFDVNGSIVEVNLTGARLLGAARSRLIGTSFQLYLAGDNRAVFRSHLEEVAGAEEKCSCELRIQKRDGSSFEADLESVPVGVSPGQTFRLRTAITDITEKKAASRILGNLKRMALVSQLAGGIAHNLNNILMVVEGNIDLALSRLPQDSSVRTELNHAYASCLKAVDLITKLIQYSRQELINPQRLDLNRLVARSLADWEDLTADLYSFKQINGRTATDVNVDPYLISKVIDCLIENAEESMAEGGKITVTIGSRHVSDDVAVIKEGQRPGNYVFFSISDDGTGISDESRPRIFEPFFTTKADFLGAGLGLSVAQGIVAQHDGWIEMESQPGHGSTFTVCLPATSPRAPGSDPTDRALNDT